MKRAAPDQSVSLLRSGQLLALCVTQPLHARSVTTKRRRNRSILITSFKNRCYPAEKVASLRSIFFHVDVAPLVHLSLQREFMGHLDWPFQLSFHGATYTLFSRGYWCKVLKNIGGTSGVWLHDERENAGIACMINRDPPAIAGQSPDTTSLFYSRAWTHSEEEYIVNSIAKITSANPDAPGTVPFAHLGNLLKLKPITDPNKVVVPDCDQSANEEPLANRMMRRGKKSGSASDPSSSSNQSENDQSENDTAKGVVSVTTPRG
jgi:hypothetical protein